MDICISLFCVVVLVFNCENNINNADKKQLKKYPPTYSLQISGEKKQLGRILITSGKEMLIFNSFYKRFVLDTHQLVSLVVPFPVYFL